MLHKQGDGKTLDRDVQKSLGMNVTSGTRTGNRREGWEYGQQSLNWSSEGSYTISGAEHLLD